MIRIHVEPGNELIEAVEKELSDAGVRDGAIVSLIGALDSCCIHTMNANDASTGNETEYHVPMELSGTGEVTDGKVHMHVVLGQPGDKALAGHLEWGRIETWHVNIYVQPA